MEASALEDLACLQKKLEKINEARRLNAKMREKLKQKLNIIESKIFSQSAPKDKLEPFYYESPRLWGLSYAEYTKLSHLFWGRIYKVPEERVLYNKSYKILFSMNDKRLLFLNQHRSPKQESLLIAKDDKCPVVFSKQLPIMPPIKYRPYSIHDVIRYYVFSKLFGKAFPISLIYPHISLASMKLRLKELKNAENMPKLEELDINPEEIQNYISSVLTSL